MSDKKYYFIIGESTPFNESMRIAVESKINKNNLIFPILVTKSVIEDLPNNYFQDKSKILEFITQITAIFEAKICNFIMIYEPLNTNFKEYVEEINSDKPEYKISTFISFLQNGFEDMNQVHNMDQNSDFQSE